MKRMSSLPALTAGVVSGVSGLLIFLIIHHIWIKPIWFIAPLGLVIAGLGGLAVGWAYQEIRGGLPPRPWTAPALVGVILATLLPALVLSEFHRPLVAPDFSGLVPDITSQEIFLRFGIELLLAASLVGALAGWFLGHTWQATLATALAGLVFALGPGHNVPFLGHTPFAAKGTVILIVIVIISALTLVEGHTWLTTQSFFQSGEQ